MQLGWLSTIIALIDDIGAIGALGDAAYYMEIVWDNPRPFSFGKMLAKDLKIVL